MKELIDKKEVLKTIDEKSLSYLENGNCDEVTVCEMLKIFIKCLPSDDSIEQIREFVKGKRFAQTNAYSIYVEILNFIDKVKK